MQKEIITNNANTNTQQAVLGGSMQFLQTANGIQLQSGNNSNNSTPQFIIQQSPHQVNMDAACIYLIRNRTGSKLSVTALLREGCTE